MGEDNDLRGDIEAALGAGGDDDPGHSAPEPGGEQQPAPPGPETDSTPAAAKPGEAPVRDSMGRFVPRAGKVETGQEPAGAPAAPQAGVDPTQPPIGQPAPAQAAPQAVPAPTGWSVGAREHWAATPPAVQQEVQRREYEMARYVNDTAPARQLGERFFQAVQPFMPTIQAEGVDPLTAVTNLMQVSTRLRMGTPGEKAATIAQIVQAYGVDIQALDSALAGQPLPAQAQGVDPNYVQQAVQQALAPLYQAAQQRQYQVAQQADGAARTELQAFAADPKNRFFNDLRESMADMIEVAQRQGYDLSLEDAYQRAGLLHPEISKVMMAERQGVNAHQLTQAAQRAKAAAVSVRGAAPVGNPNGAEPSSIRESIEAAIEQHSRF